MTEEYAPTPATRDVEDTAHVEEEIAAATALLALVRRNFPHDVEWPEHTTEVTRQLTYLKVAGNRLVSAASRAPVIKARFRDNEVDGIVTLAGALAAGIGQSMAGINPKTQAPALEHVATSLIEAAGARAIMEKTLIDNGKPAEADA